MVGNNKKFLHVTGMGKWEILPEKILPSPAQIARGHPSKTEYTFRYDQVYSGQMSQDNCDSLSPMPVDSEWGD